MLSLLLSLVLSVPLFAADWREHWEKIPVSQLPILTPDGDLQAFRLALERQEENCDAANHGKFRHCGSESSSLGLECEEGVLKKLLSLTGSSGDWRTFYKKAKSAFDWYRYKAGPGQVRFTAYNSPLFFGSLKKEGKFKYPVYGRPADLVIETGPKGEKLWRKKLPDGTVRPYDDRKAIDMDHSLEGRGLELAYFELPSDILRLQIEGSGILQLPDGKQLGLNYAASNGHPYVSVFKTLKDKKVDPKYLTFPGLQQYFLDHPGDMWPTLTASPSYVFFSLGTEPPCGTARVHVTGGHSLAVDPTQMPLGLVGFLAASRPVEGSDPAGTNVPLKPFTRFAVAQDTGGAIKGAHVDVYWGTGDYAQLASNTMNSLGSLYTMKLKKAGKKKLSSRGGIPPGSALLHPRAP